MTEAAIPLFKGEAMLLSWGDTSSRGKTVAFALHAEECGDGHPFKGLGTGKHGQRFLLIAMPLDDDEQAEQFGQNLSPGAAIPATASKSNGESPSSAAVNSTPQNTHEKAPGEPAKGGWYGLKPSARAALLCKDVDFRAWAEERFDCPLDTEADADHLLKAETDTPKKAWLNPEHEHHRPDALRKFNVIERDYRISRGFETEERRM